MRDFVRLLAADMDPVLRPRATGRMSFRQVVAKLDSYPGKRVSFAPKAQRVVRGFAQALAGMTLHVLR